LFSFLLFGCLFIDDWHYAYTRNAYYSIGSASSFVAAGVTL